MHRPVLRRRPDRVTVDRPELREYFPSPRWVVPPTTRGEMERVRMDARAVLGRTARRVGLGTVALAATLSGAAVVAPATPALADVKDSGGQWLWEGTARSVNNVRDDVGF